MADRPTSSDRAPGVKSPGARRPWPRTPDEVVTFTTAALPTTGVNVEPKCSNFGMYVVAGNTVGVEALGPAGNFYDIFAGDVLPPGVQVRSDGTYTGGMQMRWYIAVSDEDLEEISQIAQLVARGSLSNLSSSVIGALPNRNVGARITVPGGGADDVSWAAAGFQYGTISNVAGNTTPFLIGTPALGVWQTILVGAAFDGFVGNGTQWRYASATPGDIIEVTEWGRT